MTPFYRDTWVEVQLNSIFNNVKAMRKFLDPEIQIIAVVKANAYGHGDVQVARTALEAGATLLAVAFLDEAISLRKSGINEPILVLGAVRPEDAEVAAGYGLSVTVFYKEWLHEALKIVKTPLSIHIKYDTGMNRLGIKTLEELDEMLEFVKDLSMIQVDGLYTHYSSADELDTSYTDYQYENFLKAVNHCQSYLPIPLIHCGNSATGLRFPTKLFNAVRMGIAMYGLSPSEEIKNLLPFSLQEAFTLHSKLSHVKKINAGEKVSYGATYTAEKDEWIGTIPIGYADGWIRSLRNRVVLVDGERAPIVGRVCMDQLMVRLPRQLEIGTKVTLIGSQEGEYISIDEVAKEIGTINYEIPCMISYRVPRVFLKSSDVVEVENPLY
jgi:alanine racemase